MLLFNLFVQLGYLPTIFMHSVMIPRPYSLKMWWLIRFK